MEKFLVSLTIKIEEYIKFDESFVDFLEKNTTDYAFEVKQILTGEERKKVVKAIQNAVKNSK